MGGLQAQAFVDSLLKFSKDQPAITLICSLASIVIGCYALQTRLGNLKRAEDSGYEKQAAFDTFNPAVLREKTSKRSYTTSYATYSSINAFYSPHSKAEKLTEHGCASLPLLVFIHGLGGSLSQFAPLLNSLTNIAPCFGIDLPGCGLSDFAPQSYQAYTFEALAALWKDAIERCCREEGHQAVVLIGHSMGCSLSAILASSTSPETVQLGSKISKISGVVAICPKSTPPTKDEAWKFRLFLSMPDFVLDAMRALDKRGETESASVTRFVGKDADVDLKRLQMRYNTHFQTPVWKRTAIGCIPDYDFNGVGHGGMPGRDIWKGIKVPLLLIAGEGDTVTKAEEVLNIVSFLQDMPRPTPTTDSTILPSAAETPELAQESAHAAASTSSPSTNEHQSHHSIIIKTAILPSPAAHALLYDHSAYRTVAGLIENFLEKYISHHLSLGWQLQQLTTSGKWDVKNLEKWKAVTPVSGPIDGGTFRALKTLREQDEEHTPDMFVKKWADQVFAVVDISHDTPIYNTQALERGGIQYHKFATVSKIPPTVSEVRDFIMLADRLRREMLSQAGAEERQKAVAVHCHYGFNRTGFFIVCYLVEKRGYRVQDAIEEFAKQRPPGIRHDHFIDTLSVRYCVGLRKTATAEMS